MNRLHIVTYSLSFQVLCICNAVSYVPIGSNETQHNNCFTWDDDSHTIFLTCRVRNFFSPVTFVHVDSGTQVICDIDKTECTPKEKTIRFNKYNLSITIALEENKAGRNLEGKWFCKQGESTQRTEVSTSQGIIVDSWVLLKGTTIKSGNESKYIYLECSSCRQPQGLYAEFLVDGSTVGSVFQGDNGSCVYELSPCPPKMCSCSETGNMYMIRLEVKNSNTPVNYSCDMHFSDRFRNGTFSIEAMYTYTGKDFSVKMHDTNVIKNNTNVVLNVPEKTTRKTGINGPITTAASTIHVTSREKEPYNIIPIIVICFVVVLVLLMGVSCVVYIRNRDRNENAQNSKDKETEMNKLKNSSERNLCHKNVKCNTCEKDGKPTPAVFLCFDCTQYYCDSCFTIHRNMKTTSFHKYVKKQFVPDTFDVSMLECSIADHNGAFREYLCKTHDELCCKLCKTKKHPNCKMTVLRDIPVHISMNMLCKFLSEHNAVADRLMSIETFLENGLETFKMQFDAFNGQIESLSLYKRNDLEICEIEEDKQKVNESTEKMINIVKRFEDQLTDFSENTERYLTEIRRLLGEIKSQKETLQFLSKYSGPNCIVIGAKCLDTNRSLIERELNDNEQIYYILEFEHDLRNNEDIAVKKRNFLKTTFFMRAIGFVSKCTCHFKWLQSCYNRSEDTLPVIKKSSDRKSIEE